jgi:RNase P/RNase MRP subunit p29
MSNRGIIGKAAEIIYQGKMFVGTISDETKNMVHLKTEKGNKKFIKSEIVLKIDGMPIDAKKISKRPEERIKW